MGFIMQTVSNHSMNIVITGCNLYNAKVTKLFNQL